MDAMVQTLRKLVDGFLITDAPDPNAFFLYTPQARIQLWWELQFVNITHSEEWEVLQYYLLHMPIGTTLQLMAKSLDTGKSIMELRYSLTDGFSILLEPGSWSGDKKGSAYPIAVAIAENVPSSHSLAFASLRNLVARAVRDDITKRNHELGGETVASAARLRKALASSPQMSTAEARALTAASE